MVRIDSTWEQGFVLGLRSRNVRGSAIGAAMTEVRSHCAESGLAPQEAFGEPRAYADSLVFAATDEVPALPPSRVLAAILLASSLLWLAPPAVGAWLRGVGLVLSWGQLVSVGAGLLAVVAVVTCFDALLARPRLLGPAIGGLLPVIVLPSALWRDPALHWPAGPVAVVASATLVLTVAAMMTGAAAGQSGNQDALTSPLEPVAGGVATTTAGDWAWRLAPLAFLVVAALLAVVDWRAGAR